MSSPDHPRLHLLHSGNIPTISFRLDLSEIMQKNHANYSKNDEIFSDNFGINDLKGWVSVYPKGDAESKPGYVTICISLHDSERPRNDHRKLVTRLICNKEETIFTHSVCDYSEYSIGADDFFTQSYLKSNPIIEVNIELHGDKDVIIPDEPMQTFSDQLQEIYELNKEHGDITLIIECNQDDGNDDNSPPAKKRKLHKDNNNNNNNTNDDDANLSIKANSVILRSASKVFDRMLSNNMMESQNRKITIHAESATDVDDMIYFITTNNLRKDCNPLNVIKLAHYYEMNALFWKCVDKLLNDLDIYSLLNTISIFQRFEIAKGYKQLTDFAKQNIDQLKDSKEYEKLPYLFKCSVQLND